MEFIELFKNIKIVYLQHSLSKDIIRIQKQKKVSFYFTVIEWKQLMI